MYSRSIVILRVLAGGQGVTHRLFTIWSSAWQIFVSIRHYIRRYAIQVPYMHVQRQFSTFSKRDVRITRRAEQPLEGRPVSIVTDESALLPNRCRSTTDWATQTRTKIQYLYVQSFPSSMQRGLSSPYPWLQLASRRLHSDSK